MTTKSLFERLPILAFACFLIAVGTTETSSAQESTLLIASVDSGGNLISSADSVNGIVSTSRNSEGYYTVELESTGSFAGLSEDHIIPHVTILDSPFNDEVSTAHISSVTADEIQVLIRTSDVEDSLIAGAPEESDSSFYLVLSRTSPDGIVSAGSRFLLGTGFVNSNGDLVSSATIEDITAYSSRNGLGDFSVTLAKKGAFIGDQTSSYVLLLQSLDIAGEKDSSIRGIVDSVASDHAVTIQVGIDDLQDDTDHDFAFPVDKHFFYSIYRIPSTPSDALPDSKLLLFAAKVNTDGNLLSGGSPEPGSLITSNRVVEGGFTITIEKPGLFADLTTSELIVHSQVNHHLISDENSIAYFVVNDDDSGTAVVLINDVESVGQTVGVPQDRAFSVLVYRAKAEGRADLRVGRKRRLSRMKGNGVYSPSGAGQRVTAKGKGKRPIRGFFATDNDGNMIDNLLIQGRGSRKHIRTRYYQLTGGLKNITSAARTSGYLLNGLRPDETAQFETRSKFKGRSSKRRAHTRVRVFSEVSPGNPDAGKFKVKRKIP